MRKKAALSLQDWGSTLPKVAARVLADADVTQPHVYLRFSADPSKLGSARQEINRWASKLDLDVALTQDIVLALDEATTNAIEHAYLNRAGPVALFAGCDRSRHCAWAVVSDSGTWRTPRTEPSTRGRGLLLMAALADEFDVTSTASGTTVVLGWPIEDLRPVGGSDRLQVARKVS
ncbi:ATP-binding protein [Kibdelosporangium philippinense]|uniref:ATP-binding protein n=1 Tax=Kibdelosporangium philippinense TaxID=211113 RepID=A0ABS8Z4R3_9PSEU|nr:ATP-binding protein [Kibdelosporangium philippinense]MCE7002911.1 ATP-binding protein [Kibdelosporangium philippinense]